MLPSQHRNVKAVIAFGVLAAIVLTFGGFTAQDLPKVSAWRVLMGVIGAIVGMVIASLKNRDIAGWCIAGVIAPVVTIIVLAAVPDLVPDER